MLFDSMEDNNKITGGSSVFDVCGGGSSTGGCRWNPTKEQIILLEGLYSQGITTPSVEQVQEITSKLKVYSHIEGKNVFYWFQNHKARQRQKQKQDEQNHKNIIFYYNHFLHHHHHNSIPPPPLFATAPCNNNGLPSPFYIPPSPITPPQQRISTFVNGAYYQYPDTKLVVVPPGGVVAMRRHVQADDFSSIGTAGYKPAVHYQYLDGTTAMLHAVGGNIVNKSWKEDDTTLDLFPLHPTGILDEKLNYSSTSSSRNNSPSNNSAENNTLSSSSDQSCMEEGTTTTTTTSLGLQQPFFDFLAADHQRCSY